MFFYFFCIYSNIYLKYIYPKYININIAMMRTGFYIFWVELLLFQLQLWWPGGVWIRQLSSPVSNCLLPSLCFSRESSVVGILTSAFFRTWPRGHGVGKDGIFLSSNSIFPFCTLFFFSIFYLFLWYLVSLTLLYLILFIYMYIWLFQFLVYIRKSICF